MNTTTITTVRVGVALVAAVMLFFVGVTTSHAALTSGPDIIAAPASVADDAPVGAENTAQQGFDEAQDVLLTEALRCDNDVTLSTDVIYDSHMIFLNTPGNQAITDVNAVWEFDGEVVCVMSDRNGDLEVASSDELGAPGTDYPAAGFDARGMEVGGSDDYVIAGNQLTVSMNVVEPGDWIRVVTIPYDLVPPVVACEEGVNPGGKNKPRAQGTNEDGYFELVSEEGAQVFVTDDETGTVFGPFAPGTVIKYVEANGATPSIREMNGVADFMIKGQGDFSVTAVDAVGNVSEPVQCLVPNPPK